MPVISDELRREIENTVRVRELTRIRDMCLRHAQEFDHAFTNTPAAPTARAELRGKAIEAANIAETIDTLLKVHSGFSLGQ